MEEMLDQLWRQKEELKTDIYRLAIEVEHRIDGYKPEENRGVIYELKALNFNVEETGISIFSRKTPEWKQDKSERGREFILNANFENYMIMRKEDEEPFEFVMYYWQDNGLLEKNENGWRLSVAVSPVMDNAELDTVQKKNETGTVISVEGLKNEQNVIKKVLDIFEELFEQQYSVIVFPEALGTEEMLSEVKKRMRKNPEYCTFVLLPTICKNGYNTLNVLGPGGVLCIRHNKSTPFILVDEDGIAQREDLDFDRRIHLLFTEELGVVAFPICAEMLDSMYYHAVINVARADTIICPSFSPGIRAFKNTMLKGAPLNLLQIYLNTCSAKYVSRKGEISDEIVMVQLPFVEGDVPLKIFKRECKGMCSKNTCYFELAISYENEVFVVEGFHKCA